MISVIGISHHGTSVTLRERYAVPSDAQGAFLKNVHHALDGAGVALLSTCNRVEVYVQDLAGLGRDAVCERVVRMLAEQARSGPAEELQDAVFAIHEDAALAHMFRVAASLESMVVGEPQVLGQFKEAYSAAETAGTLSPTLGRALRAGLSTAKRVRSETRIGEGQVSISSVAVDLARGIVGDLKGRQVLCVGAGTMAEAALRAMQHEGAAITVCNRGEAQRVALAQAFGAQSVPLSELEVQMHSADVVIVSTGSASYVLLADMAERVMRKRRGRPLFVIDVAVPRNVDPQVHEVEDVYVYNVDDLEQRVGEGSAQRSGAVLQAEKIIDEELAAWRLWLQGLGAKDTVVSLRARIDELLKAELERTLAGKLKALGEPEREALRVMVDAMGAKLCHSPISRLKSLPPEAQALAAQALSELFGLGSGAPAALPLESSERAS